MTAHRLSMLCMTLSLLSVFAGCQPQLPEVARENTEYQFALKVLMGTEFGKAKDRVAMRWIKPPKLRVYHADEPKLELVQQAVADINSCLSPEQQIELLEGDDQPADMHLYFVNQSQFKSVFKRYDIDISTGNNTGYFYLNWDGRHQIYRAVIAIGQDRLTGDNLKHVVLEETAQSMGLATDCELFEDSVFYENGIKREWGTATKLSPRDRKLLQLLYSHLEPGMKAEAIAEQLEKHWENLNPEPASVSP